MLGKTSSSTRPYLFAVLCSGLALVLTLLIDDPLAEPNTALLFIAAVACSAWMGGLGPGLLATVLSGLGFSYFYLPPLFSFAVETTTGLARLGEFAAVGVLISALHEVRRRAQERAEAASAEAQAANRAKADFVAAVSHELRTPLASILGWLNVLRMTDPQDTKFVGIVDRIERNARTESQLIEDLLDISRIDAGQLRMDVRVIDIRKPIEASIETVRPALDGKHLELQATISPVRVSGDARRLQQVFWNLISNAVRLTPEGGRIEIDTVLTNSRVVVAVRDTGPGIEPAFLPYVFDRFRQGTTADGNRHAGLGLGLAIARHLVELHGGTIRVESAGPGCGATFIVELPIATERAGASIAA